MVMKTRHEYWVQWYAKSENREHHREMSRNWKRELRALLLSRKKNKCEKCGSMERLELHEPNGNTDKHSSGRLTKMRDGKISYQVLCRSCHSNTDDWKHGRNKNVIS